MSTPTTDAANLEKRPTLDMHTLELNDIINKRQALRDEMRIMPKTAQFLVKYEKLNIALNDEFDALGLAHRVSAQRALVIERFAGQPELVADAMCGFDQILRESREKVRDWDEYFLDRKPEKYSVYYDLGFSSF